MSKLCGLFIVSGSSFQSLLLLVSMYRGHACCSINDAHQPWDCRGQGGSIPSRQSLPNCSLLFFWANCITPTPTFCAKSKPPNWWSFFLGNIIKAELSTIRLLTAEHMEQCRRRTKKRLCSTHNFYCGQMLRDAENERGSLAFEQLPSLLCFPSLGHGNWILQRNTWQYAAFLSLVTHCFLAHGDLEQFPCCSFPCFCWHFSLAILIRMGLESSLTLSERTQET